MLRHKSQLTLAFVMIIGLLFIFSVMIFGFISNITDAKIRNEILFKMEIGNKGKQIVTFLSTVPEDVKMTEILGYAFISEREKVESEIKKVEDVLSQLGDKYSLNVTDLDGNIKLQIGESPEIYVSADIPVPGAFAENLKGRMVLGK